MNSKTLQVRILAFAVAAISWSVAADAEMHLFWHWEGGGGGSCGSFCTTVTASRLVIDGWFDDGLGSNQNTRFPTSGVALGVSRRTSEFKMEYPATPGKGCTLPSHLPRVRGIAPNGSWKVVADSRLSDELINAVTDGMEAINGDLKSRDIDVRFVWEFDQKKANALLYPSFAANVSIPPGQPSATSITFDRSGSVSDSVTGIVNVVMDKKTAATVAVRALAASVGLGTVDDQPNFPTVMSTVQVAGRTLDPCTAAAIANSVAR